MKFYPGILYCKLPLHYLLLLIAAYLPCRKLPLEFFQRVYPPIQYWLVIALNSISAIFSQLPCFGPYPIW